MNLWQYSLLGGASFKEVDLLLGGLDVGEASESVPGAPHTAAELLAHISTTMRVSLDLVSGKAQGWPDGLDVWPAPPEDPAGFDRLLTELKLMLTEARMLAADPSEHAREILLDLAVHNAYHWGQLALLRQQQGHTLAAQT